jgi:hypothetical protein
MSRVLKIALIAAAAAVLAACESMPIVAPMPQRPPPPPPPPPTPAEEFAWSTVRGPNSLTVTVAFQAAPGQGWTCAGLPEALMPETSYSRGRIMSLYGSAERALQTTAQVRARSAANPGADYGQFVKSAPCDAQDTFTIAGLPDGAYYVIARVRQTRPAGQTGDIVIMQRVELSRGQAMRITLPEGAGRAAAPPPPPAAPARPRRTQ